MQNGSISIDTDLIEVEKNELRDLILGLLK
jgi:hypothetical protein